MTGTTAIDPAIAHHPVGTVGFVADLSGIHEVRVVDITIGSSPLGKHAIHRVERIDGGEMTFREFCPGLIHPTREAARPDLAEMEGFPFEDDA